MYGFAVMTVIGNLTRDPEVKYTPQGKASALFSLAVNRTRTKKETGEKIEEVAYIDIRAWEKIAEICREAKKGDPMFVHGEVREERWEKDGQKRSKLRLVAHDIRRLPKFPPRDKPATEPVPASQPTQKSPAPQAPKPPDNGDDFEPGDNEIPF